MASKITVEQAVLIQRVGNGDVEAVEPLWATLTNIPFDSKRPLADVSQELADMLNSLSEPEDERKQAEKVADPNKALLDVIVLGTEILNDMVADMREKSK